MPSEQEKKYHRTFLSLHACETIFNEDYHYQNYPGGPPNRQRKTDSDPVFKYHVHSCPRYPQKNPGLPTDPQYNAFLTRNSGGFENVVIIPKRGQRFASVATTWELQNSVLCSNGGFKPVVNPWMEVTGHYANLFENHVIYPEAVKLRDVSDYIANDIPIYLWMYRVFDFSRDKFKDASLISLPPGWRFFEGRYGGGIDVLVLPNGNIIGANGHKASSHNGEALSVLSPIDFWAPGARLAAGAFRSLTNRLAASIKSGFQLLRAPTKELAEIAVTRLAGKTLPGMAVSTGKVALPVAHFSRRSLIMGEDMAKFRSLMARSHSESGFYDVMIHGDITSFQILVKSSGKEVWKNVSVREVADTIRPHLASGDKIRLLACDVGTTGGPAQQLANELGRTVWAPSTKLPAAPRTTGRKFTSFVPSDGGKFYEFVPVSPRGEATLAGKGGKVSGNGVQGEIRTK